MDSINYRFRPIILASICLSCLLFSRASLANEDVYYFNIQGIRLNMKLDEVIKEFQINNVKSSKDRYGLVNGYEILKSSGDMRIALNFTSKKRLYRIDFSNQYKAYARNSDAIFLILKRKYGKPDIENIEDRQGVSGNIAACWGSTCNRFSPITPALKANIEYFTGKLKLTLVDNRIFNKDWKTYKAEYNDKKFGRTKNPKEPKSDFDF